MQEVSNENQHLSDSEHTHQNSEFGYEQDPSNQFMEKTQENTNDLISNEINQDSANDDLNINENTTEYSQSQPVQVHSYTQIKQTKIVTKRTEHTYITQKKSTEPSDEQFEEAQYSRTSPTKSKSAQIKTASNNTKANNKGKRTRPQIKHSRPRLNKVHKYFQ